MDEMTVQPIQAAEYEMDALYSYIVESQIRLKRA